MEYAAVILSSLLVAAAGEGERTFRFAEDFAKLAAGPPPAAAWRTTGFTWSVRDGRLCCQDPDRTFAIVQAAPHGQSVVVEATLMAEQAVGKQWKVAGVAVVRDGRNYWHLAMAESPTDAGQQPQRHWELIESLSGRWLANVSGETALPAWGPTLAGEWDYGVAYRLRLELSPKGIRGTVTAPGGKVVWRRGFAFPAGKEAVKAGRPALDCGGFRVAFDDVKAEVGGAVAPPAGERALKPPAYDLAPMSTLRRKATGFFRVERVGGVWWLIDPKGFAFYGVGTDHARYTGHGCQKLGYAPYGRNMKRLFPREDDWCRQTAGRLRAWGFNTIAAGHSESLRHRGLVHTEFISFGARFSAYSDITPKVHWTGFPNVFHEHWEPYCLKYAEEFCRRQRSDPWLLGYFLDNELEWYGKDHSEFGLVAEAWKKPADHAAKRALVALLRRRHGTIAPFNTAWGAKAGSFDALARTAAMPPVETDAARADAHAYLALVAERYFGPACRAIRKVDPNHMVIGSRFAGRVHDVVWQAAGKHLDVVSCNYYGRVDLETHTATPTRQALVRGYELCKRPMILTEWSHPALDSNLPCTHGAGQRFDTQAQRAEAFGVYQTMLFSLPFMVGSHFFMWVDEPALGISETFPENTNYGLVNERGRPYRELTAAAARLNPRAVEFHAGRTAEISVRIDAKAARAVLANAGKVDADMPVAIWQDGRRRRRTVAVAAGGRARVALLEGPARPAHFVIVHADPDRTLPEADRSDNRAAAHLPGSGITASKAVALLAVANPTARELSDVVVRVPVARLLAGRPAKGALISPVADDHTQLPQQHNAAPGGPEVAFRIARLGPYASADYFVTPLVAAKIPPPEKLAVPFEIANGRLTLRKHEADGDLIDDVRLGDVPLGKVQAMVHEDVGQALWLAASRLVSATRRTGPVETVVDFVAEYRPGAGGEARTAVDDTGRFAARRRPGGAWRGHWRLRIAKDRPAFALACLAVTNVDERPWRLESYFHYLPSHVGSSSAGDATAAGGVPNHYGLQTVWFDAKARAGYGAVAPPLFEARFWLNRAGGQHPDVRRPIGRELKPGESWRADDPPILVFGVTGDAADRPWTALAEDLKARTRLSVHVWPGRR